MAQLDLGALSVTFSTVSQPLLAMELRPPRYHLADQRTSNSKQIKRSMKIRILTKRKKKGRCPNKEITYISIGWTLLLLFSSLTVPGRYHVSIKY